MISEAQPSSLDGLLRRARAAWDAMTPEQQGDMIRTQRRSLVRAEAGFGSDADEAAYRAALASGDKAEMERLDIEAQARIERAEAVMVASGL